MTILPLERYSLQRDKIRAGFYLFVPGGLKWFANAMLSGTQKGRRILRGNIEKRLADSSNYWHIINEANKEH